MILRIGKLQIELRTIAVPEDLPTTAALGAVPGDGGITTFRVWAPRARSVAVRR
jgi:1,4-alpha-glucan branching enzyme